MTSRHLREELRKILTYGLVGLFNTGLTAGIMWLSSRASIPYPVYTTYAYLIGMLSSFGLNWAFTFRQGDQGGRGMTLLRFAAVNLTLLGFVHLLQYRPDRATPLSGILWSGHWHGLLYRSGIPHQPPLGF